MKDQPLNPAQAAFALAAFAAVGLTYTYDIGHKAGHSAARQEIISVGTVTSTPTKITEKLVLYVDAGCPITITTNQMTLDGVVIKHAIEK
jgi:hypothetical protein